MPSLKTIGLSIMRYFQININFPQDYTFRSPRINFITKIYHPNIDQNGSISLNILKESWTPPALSM